MGGSFSLKSRLSLVSLGLVNLSSGVVACMPAPFLPSYLQDNYHSSSLEIGLIFALMSLSNFFFSPIVGHISARVDRRKLIYTLGAVLTVGNFAFGYSTSFVEMALFRVMQGIGAAGCQSMVGALVLEWFPKSQQPLAFAVVYACISAGYSIGPAVGGVLYTHSFALPFIFSGVVVMVAVASIFVVSRFFSNESYVPLLDETAEQKQVQDQQSTLLEQQAQQPTTQEIDHDTRMTQVWKLALSPFSVFYLFVVGIVCMSYTGLEPLFAQFLQDRFNMSVSYVSLVFSYLALNCGIALISYNWLFGRFHPANVMIIFNFLYGVSWLLLGPVHGMDVNNDVYQYGLLFVSVTLLAQSFAIVFGPCLKYVEDVILWEMKQYRQQSSVVPNGEKQEIIEAEKDKIAIGGVLAGLFVSFQALGQGLGPIITGALHGIMDTQWIFTCIAILNITILLLIFKKTVPSEEEVSVDMEQKTKSVEAIVSFSSSRDM